MGGKEEQKSFSLLDRWKQEAQRRGFPKATELINDGVKQYQGFAAPGLAERTGFSLRWPCNQELWTPVEHLSPRKTVHLLVTIFPYSGPVRKAEHSPGRGSPRTTWVSVPCPLLSPCVTTLLAQGLMVSSCAILHLKTEATNSKFRPLALQWELDNSLAWLIRSQASLTSSNLHRGHPNTYL